MRDIMVDTETLGTKPGSIVLAIAAVTFDPYSDDEAAGYDFYTNIDRDSAEEHGLKADRATELWWSKQDPSARDALLVNPKPLPRAMSLLSKFILKHKCTRVWCQGANFDAVLLEACFQATGIEVPWSYYNVRDTRTVYELAALDHRAVKRSGTHHKAIDDCYHQIKCLQLAIKTLGAKDHGLA